jgi:hypothetical protein
MPPNPVKDEGSPDDVVSRNFVADINNSQVTVCRKKVGLQAGEVEILAAEVGGKRKQGR